MNGVPWWFFDGLEGPAQGLRLESADPGGMVHAAVPAAHVIGCVVHLSATTPAAGVVRHVNGQGLVVGAAVGPGDAATEAVATADRILDDPLVRAFCSAVMREARALGAAFGIPIEQEPEERHAVTRRLGAFRTSMLQDLEAGRPLEPGRRQMRERCRRAYASTFLLPAALSRRPTLARHGTWPRLRRRRARRDSR
jgi:2-dehydropantoate 2-reductase